MGGLRARTSSNIYPVRKSTTQYAMENIYIQMSVVMSVVIVMTQRVREREPWRALN